MDFRFTLEEEAFRKEVHDFIENECPKELRGGDVSFFEQAGHLFTWRRKVAQKGWVASSVSLICWAPRESSERTQSVLRPSGAMVTKARRLPSGETAKL